MLDAAQYKSSMLVLAVSKNGPGAGQINKNLLERFSLTTFTAQGEKAWQKKSLLSMLLKILCGPTYSCILSFQVPDLVVRILEGSHCGRQTTHRCTHIQIQILIKR